MTSLLITGGTLETRQDAAQKKADKLSRGPDLVIFEDAVGIDEVRQIKAVLSRKPYQSQAVTIIVGFADKMSPEASNAILKTLEEPPGFAKLILLAENSEQVLPTIRSRCQEINLGPVEVPIKEADLKLAWKLYRTGSLGELFDQAASTQPLVWTHLVRQLLLYRTGGKILLTEAGGGVVLTDFIEVKELEQVTSQVPLAKMQRFLGDAHQASDDLKHNVNERLVVENLLLSLPKPS